MICRPATRGECPAERPCPFVTCRHNLAVEVTGKGVVQTPLGEEPEAWGNNCALDHAARGDMTLEEVGEVMGLTRERIRQIESSALAKLRALDNGQLEQHVREDVAAHPGPLEERTDEALKAKARAALVRAFATWPSASDAGKALGIGTTRAGRYSKGAQWPHAGLRQRITALTGVELPDPRVFRSDLERRLYNIPKGPSRLEDLLGVGRGRAAVWAAVQTVIPEEHEQRIEEALEALEEEDMQSLAKWMKEQGKTAAEVAKALGVSESSVYMWRRGKATPSASNEAKLTEMMEADAVETLDRAADLTAEIDDATPEELDEHLQAEGVADSMVKDMLEKVEERTKPITEQAATLWLDRLEWLYQMEAITLDAMAKAVIDLTRRQTGVEISVEVG